MSSYFEDRRPLEDAASINPRYKEQGNIPFHLGSDENGASLGHHH